MWVADDRLLTRNAKIYKASNINPNRAVSPIPTTKMASHAAIRDTLLQHAI